MVIKHADLAVFSFHPVKTVTAGEGGMVLTNDDELAKVRMYANHGMERSLENFQTWEINNNNGKLIGTSEDSKVKKHLGFINNNSWDLIIVLRIYNALELLNSKE